MSNYGLSISNACTRKKANQLALFGQENKIYATVRELLTRGSVVPMLECFHNVRTLDMSNLFGSTQCQILDPTRMPNLRRIMINFDLQARATWLTGGIIYDVQMIVVSEPKVLKYSNDYMARSRDMWPHNDLICKIGKHGFTESKSRNRRRL